MEECAVPAGSDNTANFEVTPARSDSTCLVVEIDGHRFGFALGDVVELLRAVAIRRVPGTPPVIEGVVDLRGELVPVLDMRARFALPPKELEHTEHLLLASDGRRRVAIRADRALGITAVEAAEVLPGHVVAPGRPALAGVARLPDGVLLLQDLAAFLSQAEESALEDALAGAP